MNILDSGVSFTGRPSGQLSTTKAPRQYHERIGATWFAAALVACGLLGCATGLVGCNGDDANAGVDMAPADPDLAGPAPDMALPPGTGTLPYTVKVVDTNHQLDPDTDAVLANLEAAVADWSHWVDSKGTVSIEIDVVDNTATGRFSGGPGYQVFLEERGGHQVYELAAVHKMRTGEAAVASVPDVIISIQPKYMRDNYWIDPDPKTRTTPVPKNKVDLVTVLAHELGHGLGLEGLVTPATGVITDGMSTTNFDELFLGSPDIHTPVLNGSHIVAAYGGPAPLTYFATESPSFAIMHNGMSYLANESPTQNYYHYGRFAANGAEGDLTFFGLMAGAWINPSKTEGLRIRVNALDAAILADLGVTMKQP